MTPVETTGSARQIRSLRVLGHILTRPGAVTGLVIVLAFTLVAIFAPLIAPYDPNATSWTAIRNAPSALHWLGTDELGRDVLSRVMFGARASLTAGVLAVAVAFAIGVPLGILSGYLGGWVDAVMMRVVDAMLAIPYLVLAIAFAAFLGPSLFNVMVALGLSTAPILMRIDRGQALAIKVEVYIEASLALGLSSFKIMWRHILPNAVAPLIIQSTLAIATAIIAEASLAFLGLGQQPPSASWGSMLTAPKPRSTLRRGSPFIRASQSTSPCWVSICWVTGCVTRSIPRTSGPARAFLPGRVRQDRMRAIVREW